MLNSNVQNKEGMFNVILFIPERFHSRAKMILVSRIDQDSMNGLSVNSKKLNIVLEEGYQPRYQQHWDPKPFTNKTSHNKKTEVELIKLQIRIENLLKELQPNLENFEEVANL